MSVYKRGDGRWQVLIDLDRGADGKRRRRAIGTFPTRKKAEAAERDALAARDRGVDLAPARVTLGVVVERYLADRATRCGDKTLEEYRGIARRYVVPHLGPTPLAKLRPVHVSEWQAALADRGGKDGVSVSPKTVFHARSLLGGALTWAVKMGLVERNVVAAVDAPAVRRSHAKALSGDEIARLLDVAAATRWHPFLCLAFALGARRGELLALRWSSVDLERRAVTIAAALSQTKAGITVKSTKTDRVRTLPLSAFAIDALRRQKVQQAQEKLAAGGAYCDGGLVFANVLGGVLSPWAATYAFAQYARAAGISSTRLHDARHTAATTMLVAGVDARSVAGVLGHSSAVTTLGVYAHLLDGPMVAAADHLGAAMERASTGVRRA